MSTTSRIEEGEKSNARRALRIVEAVAGEPVEIKSLLGNSGIWINVEPARIPESAARRSTPSEHASRTRWFPWQCRTPSCPAAYNTACLYGVAFEHCNKAEQKWKISSLAVISLRRAFGPQDSEMQRPSDWIDVDPVFVALKKTSSPNPGNSGISSMSRRRWTTRIGLRCRRENKRSVALRRAATQRGNITETKQTLLKDVE